MEYSSLIILVLIIWALNIALDIVHRKKLPGASELSIDDVPKKYKSEVKYQINNGYNLSSASDDEILMYKKKKYFLPWLLVLLRSLPLNTAFTSTYLCNLYCIRITEVNNEIITESF